MAGTQHKFRSRGFARVHRNAIIDLDLDLDHDHDHDHDHVRVRVREIESFDTGDARAHLLGGARCR